jgi:hypothetical protein
MKQRRMHAMVSRRLSGRRFAIAFGAGLEVAHTP